MKNRKLTELEIVAKYGQANPKGTGYFGKDLVVNEFIFNSFMILTLGAFGFSSVDKFTNKKKQQDNE